MVNISSPQNHNEIALLPYSDDKNKTITNVDEGAEKLDSSYKAGGNIKWLSYLGKQPSSSSKG